MNFKELNLDSEASPYLIGLIWSLMFMRLEVDHMIRLLEE